MRRWEFRDAALRALDVGGCLVLLMVLFLPALCAGVLAALAFGNPFYTERRRGWQNADYLHVKFRTMKPGLSLGRSYLERRRIPPVFRIVRAVHIDEYPELILVLLGRLSLVGPRPLPRRVIAGCLTQPGVGRALVRPGLTGLAQLKLGRRGNISSYSQFALDEVWVRRRSINLYLAILGETAGLIRRTQPGKISPKAKAYRQSLLSQAPIKS